MKIITDHKMKQFKYGYEVPKRVLVDQFSHLDDAETQDRFLCYRKRWYHTSDFLRIDNNSPLIGWDGYLSDSFFSGVVIKCSRDCEGYRVGTFIS